MALTKNADIARIMRQLRSHGITREHAEFEISSDAISEKPLGYPAWYYEQQMLGFNYRMTDIQAALGLSQIGRIRQYVAKRNELARVYDKALSKLPLQLPYVRDGVESAFHLYVVRLLPGSTPAMHRHFFDGMRMRGVGVNLHYQPVHLQPHYRRMGFADGAFPQAEHHGQSAVTLPLYPGLTEREQTEVVSAIEACLADLKHG